MEDLIEALQILSRYGCDSLQPEHDILYSIVTPEKLPPTTDDGKRLEELGWFVDDNIDVWAKYESA